MRPLCVLALVGLAVVAERWKRLALVDPITGSGNFLALRRFRRRNRPFTGSLFLLDIDGFAKINSTFSYTAGDRVLSELVSGLAHHLGGTARIFRYKYGDEFLGILEGGSELDGQKRKERFIRDVEQRSFSLGDPAGDTHVSVSVGYMFVEQGWLSNEGVFDFLEGRLQEAKCRDAVLP
jgi:diguanylate cyclase (GGDEF)-like protein